MQSLTHQLCRGSAAKGSSNAPSSPRATSWEITPDRLLMARQADGQLVKLGSGAFGTVLTGLMSSLMSSCSCCTVWGATLHQGFILAWTQA